MIAATVASVGGADGTRGGFEVCEVPARASWGMKRRAAGEITAKAIAARAIFVICTSPNYAYCARCSSQHNGPRTDALTRGARIRLDLAFGAADLVPGDQLLVVRFEHRKQLLRLGVVIFWVGPSLARAEHFARVSGARIR